MNYTNNNNKMDPSWIPGNKSNRSIHWVKSNISNAIKSQPCNHTGFMIVSSSSHGNTASNWSASPQSPPRIEIRAVTKECLT